MRVRSVLITAVAGAALFAGSASAAHAGPKGPGGLGNTPTTVKPQCCKDIQNPTTTTTPPKPKGPGDISDTPKDPVVDPKPVDPQDGPDDIAPAPKGGDVEPGPDTTGNGSGNQGVGPNDSADTGANVVDATDTGNGAEVIPAVQTDNGDEAASHNETSNESSNMPAFLIIFFALLTAALIGLVVARMRSDDEDVERV